MSRVASHQRSWTMRWSYLFCRDVAWRVQISRRFNDISRQWPQSVAEKDAEMPHQSIICNYRAVVECSLPLYHLTFSTLWLECRALLFSVCFARSKRSIAGGGSWIANFPASVAAAAWNAWNTCSLSIHFWYSFHLILLTGKIFGRTFFGTFADSCGPHFDQAIYQRFAPNGVVYDACAGWGGRLLGAPLGDADKDWRQVLNHFWYKRIKFTLPCIVREPWGDWAAFANTLLANRVPRLSPVCRSGNCEKNNSNDIVTSISFLMAHWPTKWSLRGCLCWCRSWRTWCHLSWRSNSTNVAVRH